MRRGRGNPVRVYMMAEKRQRLLGANGAGINMATDALAHLESIRERISDVVDSLDAQVEREQRRRVPAIRNADGTGEVELTIELPLGAAWIITDLMLIGDGLVWLYLNTIQASEALHAGKAPESVHGMDTYVPAGSILIAHVTGATANSVVGINLQVRELESSD